MLLGLVIIDDRMPITFNTRRPTAAPSRNKGESKRYRMSCSICTTVRPVQPTSRTKLAYPLTPGDESKPISTTSLSPSLSLEISSVRGFRQHHRKHHVNEGQGVLYHTVLVQRVKKIFRRRVSTCCRQLNWTPPYFRIFSFFILFFAKVVDQTTDRTKKKRNSYKVCSFVDRVRMCVCERERERERERHDHAFC